MKFQNLLNSKSHIIFDGAMGTELQARGLKPGEPSELFNFTNPDKVAEVNRNYAQSGSNIVSANTFCANRYKLAAIGKSADETISAAITIARDALSDYPDTLIALDIGPIGQLLRPAGTLTFDEAYDIFAEMVRAGVGAGADLVVLQTFSDLLEIKAAILAVKEHSELPVICSMTFEASGRTFTGCPVSAYAVTASALGADVIGVNCSLGPKELKPIVAELLEWTDLPIMVKPNAGLPDPVTGKFGLNAEDFADEMREIAEKAQIVGGCCGTSPEYIEKLRRVTEGVAVNRIRLSPKSTVTSGVKTVVIDRACVIGERINPTGKRIFQEALRNSDTDYILGQAIEQVRAGADILDVNVGLPGIDERKMMLKVIESLQSVCDLPLQIDSGDPEVIETALRHYNGKAIVNSVNGKEESLSAILPLVKKYGAMVIGLTLDENGIPDSAQARLEIARKIMERALYIGINKEDIVIDCLTMTVSTDSQAAMKTLQAVKSVKQELGLKTALGVSNVSFGLPNRELINSTFLTAALHNGLDLPIINPNAAPVMNAVRASRLLANQDENAKEFIEIYAEAKSESPTKSENKSAPAVPTMESIMEELDKAGRDFEAGRIFLPQLIYIAESVKKTLDEIEKRQPKGKSAEKNGRKVILATVKGDIHDIGKNIVKSLLESYGYRVIDLGKDVSPEEVADAAAEHGVKLVGLSALMTTTLPAMQDTIKLLRERGSECEVMVGGAILTADYAESIGAEYYAKDAKGAVDIAKKVFP
jgi:5-methyltetrahydrofolate--homocysteine methyltransferase